ncbi:hypothetical protein FE773_00885 [Caminibacter mediatlanticus TB-2]|uniref:Uncharacterized protein n=1 Tax=Caminibacter mediatlanticus TB-2 TaxID=391592 RepID=A0ABX5V680_9BACT|nr:hypothetical protein [Caminibacter mediatlanticus]QCT93782.1 hypothetical protein FE773_00885 [Caminibacter mediatlanticus TB-2]
MKDLFTAFKIVRFFIALVVSLIAWVILSIILTLIINNDVTALIISTSFILITLFLYTKELIKE